MLSVVTRLMVVVLLLSAGAVYAAGHAAFSSVALYYADTPPVNELKAFDVVVVDPDSKLTPAVYGAGPSQLFAYVSVGEAEPNRPYFKEFQPDWLMGDNKAWKSKLVDVSNPAWQQFFLDRIVEPLWQAGYRGFFLDTLDSYQLAAKKADFARMEAGLAVTIRALHQRHPEARLILNRGFEIFGQIKDVTFAVAAESLYQNFSPATGTYGVVPATERTWLLERLHEVKKAGVPVVVIDYVPPGKRELARQTAHRIRSHGFIPWVADKDLASLGVGSVEVMPRIILGFYDSNEADDVVETELHRLGTMPLNYLGYQVELHDLRKPLPREILAGRYAGVVVWPFSSEAGEQQGLREWVGRCIAEGVPIVFLDRFGVAASGAFLKGLGLESTPVTRITAPLKITHLDARVGFEQKPVPQMGDLMPLKLKAGQSLLRVASANGVVSDAVAITPWGGYALQPFVISAPSEEQAYWVIDPFRFYKDALRLPDMPVPDVTTENGTRLLLTHVDGDGFESYAEWPGGRISGIELRERILKKYRLPIAISLITGVTASNGLYPKDSAFFEKEARKIFELPWVEAASHTFSHPYKWQKLDEGDADTDYNLKIPGYRFNLTDEISGSVATINRLLPAGKKTTLLLWSGDCTPGADAIEETYRAGVRNMNSGDTLLSETNKSLTAVAPLGVSKDGWFQTFAPNQNENMYTNEWTGPFYGFQRVIETFRMTDKPRRLKPVNIYYHFYSASKESSINALRKVYDWAQGQRLFSIFASEYVDKVLDFNRTVVARADDGWLVRNSGALRQMRIPLYAGYPDFAGSRRVAGFNDHAEGRYLHLMPGGEAHIRLSPTPPGVPYLVSAGGMLESFERKGSSAKIGLIGYTPFRVQLAGLAGCRIRQNQGVSQRIADKDLLLELPEGRHQLEIECR